MRNLVKPLKRKNLTKANKIDSGQNGDAEQVRIFKEHTLDSKKELQNGYTQF